MVVKPCPYAFDEMTCEEAAARRAAIECLLPPACELCGVESCGDLPLIWCDVEGEPDEYEIYACRDCLAEIRGRVASE